LHAATCGIYREFSRAFAPAPTLLEVELIAEGIDFRQIEEVSPANVNGRNNLLLNLLKKV
jgi:hypothetical protein